MPLNLKTLSDFIRSAVGKFQKELPTVDPTIEASLQRGVNVASASVGVGLQEGLKDGVDQAFIQTADGEFLDSHAQVNNVVKFDPQPSTGFCAGPGTLGTVIPIGTQVTANGNTYTTLQESSVQEYSGSVTLSFSGGIVTAVTDAAHSLSTGLDVTLSGATQTEYNGTFDITVLDDQTFTYELEAGGLTPDAGDYVSEYALLQIESVGTGSSQNIGAGGALSINVIDIDGTLYAGVDGISGGLDEEDQEDYRDRAIDSYSTTPGVAAPPAMVLSAKSIAGNTRVFLVRPKRGVTGGTPGVAGYKPSLGETVIYILRDNDLSIIPTQAILDQTKQKILDDGNWPTNFPDGNLYLLAPILAPQPFVFSSITPNTTTMQNAIRNQLVAFFQDNADIDKTINEDTYLAFLRTIQDESTGQFLTDFTLDSPSGDLVPDSGEILTRGTVSFP